MVGRTLTALQSASASSFFCSTWLNGRNRISLILNEIAGDVGNGMIVIPKQFMLRLKIVLSNRLLYREISTETECHLSTGSMFRTYRTRPSMEIPRRSILSEHIYSKLIILRSADKGYFRLISRGINTDLLIVK